MGKEGNTGPHRRRTNRRRVYGIESIGDGSTLLSLEAIVPYTLQIAKPVERRENVRATSNLGVSAPAADSTRASRWYTVPGTWYMEHVIRYMVYTAHVILCGIPCREHTRVRVRVRAIL